MRTDMSGSSIFCTALGVILDSANRVPNLRLVKSGAALGEPVVRLAMDIALFSPSSLFGDSDASSFGDERSGNQESFVERKHQFPSVELIIREFSFHQFNANLLWPGTFAFADWLVHHRSWIEGKRVLELGSGTGALAIFLQKSFQLDITTSDYDDAEIEENIAYNCRMNDITPVLPHIRHSWGDTFPVSDPNWELIIASDILLYVKQYTNLIKSLSFLLKCYKPGAQIETNHYHNDTSEPAFLMSWRRRIGKDDELLFFNGCEEAGLNVHHLGSRVYCIKPRRPQPSEA